MTSNKALGSANEQGDGRSWRTGPQTPFKHALMLQGPMGPFFRRLAQELSEHGVRTTKLNFNAGDALFFRAGVPYRGTHSAFAAHLEQTVRALDIDALILFGDGRPYHRTAVKVAKGLGIQVLVFEEGYLRPDWITLEQDGVNANSLLPRDPEFYRHWAEPAEDAARVVPVGKSFRFAAWHSAVYSLALTLGRSQYPHYTHHRPLHAAGEAVRWVRGGARKLWFQFRERHVLDHLVAEDRKSDYFLVALQVHCDYQLAHSDFDTVEDFIEQVVASFAAHADPSHRLVVKHHPLDRPYREYGALMRELAARHGLGPRLVYIHDLHLPTLLRHALGSVMINSTVGLQSLQYGTPVKLLGKAVYDLAGLTHQGSLDDFWKQPGSVDDRLYRGFRAYLLRTNQVNGSFYRRLPSVDTPTGIRWRVDEGPRPAETVLNPAR